MIKTHSIVMDDTVEGRDCCKLRSNHIGMPVVYKNVTGWLIRYITSCEHKLLELDDSETRECISLNTVDDGASI